MIEGGWDGADLLAAMRRAAAELRAGVDEVNALNVFPVPDGDTGTNMLATLMAALEEAGRLPAGEMPLPRVAAAFSFGALMGARGNSGVILSQFLRGIADAVEQDSHLDGRRLAMALQRGCEAAFAAVARPVEGTMLTVARDAAEAASRAAVADARLEAVLAASASEAAAAVARTPSQLAVLRRAGVVDAGGRGLELLLRGALAYERGEAAGAVEVHEIDLPALDGLEEDGYGYETVFVVTAGEGSPLDLAALRSELDRLGESVLVAGSERAAKIHVHNERPDQVIALGLRFGSLSRITVENLDRQAQDVRRTASPIEPAAQALPAIEAPAIQQHARGPVVVAVAPGSGLAGVFSAAGAATVVAGGQSANPSAGELATAIRSTGREEVIVLANNANARLAAEQAARLCPDVEVAVVPTRNPAEGVAAMLSLDPAASMAANVKRMVIAVRALQTLQVTVAIRDARIGRRKVHKDDYIVLGPDDKLLAAGSDCRRAVLDAIGRLKPGFELLTLYRGEGVDEQAGAALSRAIADSLDGVDVEVVDGGQPHYRYLISAE